MSARTIAIHVAAPGQAKVPSLNRATNSVKFVHGIPVGVRNSPRKAETQAMAARPTTTPARPSFIRVSVEVCLLMPG